MRERLFRGKSKESGEWIYGYVILTEGKAFILNNVTVEFRTGYNENRLNFVLQEVIPESIGEYCELTDKNGTKIFEGDIVESRASENKEDWKYWQVIFYDGSYCFEREVKKRKYKYEQNLLCEDEVSLYGLVVVGNIHDNPELLKGAEK